jgi:hypothetical protein
VFFSRLGELRDRTFENQHAGGLASTPTPTEADGLTR